MATTVSQASASWSLAASTTNWGFLGSCFFTPTATESRKKLTYRTAGTFSNLYINVLTNDRNASTFRTRKATANANLVCSITGSTTGKFADTTNTDVVTAGDDWHSQLTTGSGGTVFTAKETLVLFSSTANTSARAGGTDVSFSTASATTPVNFWGAIFPNTGLDSVVALTYRTAGTLKNMFINVRTNARTTTTSAVSRINSATGALAISITAGTTGTLEDTTHSDVVANGDLVNFALVSSTGTETLVYDSITADFESTNGQQMYVNADGGGDAQAAGVTTYYAFMGAPSADTTEANVLAQISLPLVLSLLQINISANTIALDSTLRLRKNSGNANQVVTITALTTGLFRDTTNKDTILASDTLDYQLVTPSTATSLTIRSISVLGDSSTTYMTTNTGYWGSS